MPTDIHHPDSTDNNPPPTHTHLYITWTRMPNTHSSLCAPIYKLIWCLGLHASIIPVSCHIPSCFSYTGIPESVTRYTICTWSLPAPVTSEPSCFLIFSVESKTDRTGREGAACESH